MRSGACIASHIPTAPPSESPQNETRSIPRSSRSASTPRASASTERAGRLAASLAVARVVVAQHARTARSAPAAAAPTSRTSCPSEFDSTTTGASAGPSRREASQARGRRREEDGLASPCSRTSKRRRRAASSSAISVARSLLGKRAEHADRRHWPRPRPGSRCASARASAGRARSRARSRAAPGRCRPARARHPGLTVVKGSRRRRRCGSVPSRRRRRTGHRRRPARSRPGRPARAPGAVEHPALRSDRACGAPATSSACDVDEAELEERPDRLRRRARQAHAFSSGVAPRAAEHDVEACKRAPTRASSSARSKRADHALARRRVAHRLVDRVVRRTAGRRGSTSASRAARVNARPKTEKWMCAGRQALSWFRQG